MLVELLYLDAVLYPEGNVAYSIHYEDLNGIESFLLRIVYTVISSYYA
jgi:hypothetical protein